MIHYLAIFMGGLRLPFSATPRQRRTRADKAIRLGRFFDVDPRFWLNLQDAFDLSVAESEHDYSGIRKRA
jgi:plasmid maintenance system antidote protein VapI